AAVLALLTGHPAVSQVHHPSLPDHPGHHVARRQQRGFGAMVSFELEGGVTAVRAFLAGLQCISLAESLGGVESLVAHPATMTHASMDAAARERAGISEALLRLSVGIEAAEDLVRDLERGLRRAVEGAGHVTLPAVDLRADGCSVGPLRTSTGPSGRPSPPHADEAPVSLGARP
ncbi:MAG TPA: PLP-dependent transferase, partial [Longimicrobiales bacterium]|nr:PLP-dependent transferase [Longimicrobiales bacterium]